MDRRQLLHALNAIGVSTVLPESAQSNGEPSAIKGWAVPEMVDTAWDIPKIGIVSVGGIGGAFLPSALSRIQSLPYLHRTVAIDTCGVALSCMNADRKVLVGDGKTLLISHAAGLLAPSASQEVARAVADLDMVLLVAGMGGNAGAGIAPAVAQILRKQGILTLGFAVMPFDGEGPLRQQLALAGVRELRPKVDALMPFFNNSTDPSAQRVKGLSAAAQQAPQAFFQLCQNIMNPVCSPGLVNIDFEDLRNNILGQPGDCALGFGISSGADGVAAAALLAINHPMLGPTRLQRASAALIAISAPAHTTWMLRDSRDAMNSVRKMLPPDAFVIYAVSYDASLGDEMTVSILASGIEDA